MELNALITEACSKDPAFEAKWLWWKDQRRKSPGLDWLMPKLEDILGRDYVENAARELVASQTPAPEETESKLE